MGLTAPSTHVESPADVLMPSDVSGNKGPGNKIGPPGPVTGLVASSNVFTTGLLHWTELDLLHKTNLLVSITVFRCLSSFKIENHISLESSV